MVARYQALMSHWLETAAHLQLPGPAATRGWELIASNYQSRLRAYHSLQHLEEMVLHFKRVRAKLHSPHAVSMAIFFHDLIYDPTRHDNEELSAKAFEEFARDDVPNPSPLQELTQSVVDMILQTKHHMQCPSSAPLDTKYFLDMDLAILGSNKERYEEYMRDIRIEYEHVPHDLYTKGRSSVLRTFLMAPQLYFTPEFREALDATARKNLAYELGVLSTPEVSSRRLTIADLPEVLQFIKAHWTLGGGSQSDTPSAAGKQQVGGGESPTTAGNTAGGARSPPSLSRVVRSRSLNNSPTMNPTGRGAGAQSAAVAVPDPMALSEEAVIHAITSNMDCCLSYRCAHSGDLIAMVLCTRVLHPNVLPPADDVGRVAKEQERQQQTTATMSFTGTSDTAAAAMPFAVPTAALESSRLDHHIAGSHVVVQAIVVHSNRRRRGLASSLLRNVMAVVRAEQGEAAAAGSKRPPISALCWVDTPMHGLLRKLGFTIVDDVTKETFTFPRPPVPEENAEAGSQAPTEEGGGDTAGSPPSSPTAATETRRRQSSVAVTVLSVMALQKQMVAPLPTQVLEMTLTDW